MSVFHRILEQLSKKLDSAQSYKSDIAKDISTVVGISITPDQITITQGKLFFLVSPTVHSALLLKKEKILKVVKKYSITTMV